MSSNIMTYYEYISDHVISSKLELYALLSNSYTIFSLEDLLQIYTTPLRVPTDQVSLNHIVAKKI